MSFLSTTQTGKVWLRNFDRQDVPVATVLLDSLLLVSASEFAATMSRQLADLAARAEAESGTVALYAEREVDKDENDDILPLFPGMKEGRAIGPGVPPVVVAPNRQDVGSEGILAALISKFRYANSNVVLSHPGPDDLRAMQVRTIAIVTDFVGSGRRVYEMLEAFAKVATIQSWRSYGLIKFVVVSYSATEHGAAIVRQHSLKPTVVIHVACPTIANAFKGAESRAIRLLCEKYPRRERSPMGFNSTGSLIAFSHGMPNNAPAIFHSSRGNWKPLFKGRSTLLSDLEIAADPSDHIIQQSKDLLRVERAQDVLRDPSGELWTHAMLVLYAVRSGLRSVEVLSARTRLPLARVTEVLEVAKTAGWTSEGGRLTGLGRRELRWQATHNREQMLAPENSDLYFPNQLKAP